MKYWFQVVAIFVVGVVQAQGYTVGAKENCTLEVRSRTGTPVSCECDPPLPLVVSAAVKITKKVKWDAGNSWKFALQDSSRKFTAFEGCISGQSLPGDYDVDSTININFMCHQMPR